MIFITHHPWVKIKNNIGGDPYLHDCVFLNESIINIKNTANTKTPIAIIERGGINNKTLIGFFNSSKSSINELNAIVFTKIKHNDPKMIPKTNITINFNCLSNKDNKKTPNYLRMGLIIFMTYLLHWKFYNNWVISD